MQSPNITSEFPERIVSGDKLTVKAVRVENVEDKGFDVAIFTLMDDTEKSTTAGQVVSFARGDKIQGHLEAALAAGDGVDLYFKEEPAINPTTNKPTGRNALKVSLFKK